MNNDESESKIKGVGYMDYKWITQHLQIIYWNITSSDEYRVNHDSTICKKETLQVRQ